MLTRWPPALLFPKLVEPGRDEGVARVETMVRWPIPGHFPGAHSREGDAAQDDVRTLPGPVLGEECSLSGHPVVPEPHGFHRIAVGPLGDVPAEASLLRHVIGGLDPQVCIEQRGGGAHAGAGALHQYRRCPGWNHDVALAAVSPPRRWGQG